MKSTVIDALSGREVFAGPEETDATQPLVNYLVQRLGWHPKQIMTRPQWRVPKTPSLNRVSGYPIDIAIFTSPEDVGDPTKIRIIAECKASNVNEGIEQLKIYLSLEPEARLGIWFNGRTHRIVYKLDDRFVVSEYAPIPRSSDPLVPTTQAPPKRYRDLLPPPNMGEIFWRLRDRIAAQDTRVNRDEYILNDLANLLVCKIADEQLGESEPERTLAFQTSAEKHITALSIKRFFDDVKQRLPSVFTDASDTLHIDDASLDEVVKGLESYRLLGYDRHAVGTAFQVLRGRALQGEEGAYFTPPPIVDCIVQILAPDHKTRLVDTACGTGGFLAAALDYVFETIDSRENIGDDVRARTKRDWAQTHLNAVDKDFVSTKLCKAYLTLLGDGRAHVYRANSIDTSEWKSRSDDVARALTFNSFDMIMTNPPFGQNLVVAESVARQEKLATCQKWSLVDTVWQPTGTYVEQQLGIAFFERNIELLKEGGRMAIVLPETFLFSKSFQWFIDWICRSFSITHIIDVPMVAFEEFCRAKTCIVFLSKEHPPAGHEITMSYPRSIGQDRKGNPLYQLNEHGRRSGKLDNELADATREIVGSEYRGNNSFTSKKIDTRTCFRVTQKTARLRGILVPRFWWREDSKNEIADYMSFRPSRVITLGELVDQGVIETYEGHGSPPGNARATGDVPYVKVTDLKNWRINENPTNFVHSQVAEKLKRSRVKILVGDLITPSRASSNIGQFSYVLPWQTNILLTKEVLIIRVAPNDLNITSHLMLALMSLKVVQNQYKTLNLMQTNREHLGDHWREIILPLPLNKRDADEISEPVRVFFEAIEKAHESLKTLDAIIAPTMFGTRP